MIPWLLKNPALSAALGGCIVLAGLLGVSRVQLATARADGATAGLAVAQGAAEIASLRADIAEQRETFEREARATEARHRLALDGVAAHYEQEKANVEAHAAGVAAGLRNGTISLRRAWAGCESARLSADAGAIAAVAEQDRLRRESLQRVLGWVGQLQAERNECVDGWAAVTGQPAGASQ